MLIRSPTLIVIVIIPRHTKSILFMNLIFTLLFSVLHSTIVPIYHLSSSGFPLVGGGGLGGIPPPLPEKLACPPTVLTQKCQFCHFHAVFGHFVQIILPLVDPNWETLIIETCNIFAWLKFRNIIRSCTKTHVRKYFI